MAAQYIPIKRISTLDTPIKAEKLDGSLFTTENQAHEFIISVRKNGVKQTVTGSVSGKFIRANGTTIFLQGSIVDGDAVVRLHQDCYNVQGRFTFNIFNTQSGVTTCIYSAVGKMDMGSTETVIDAGDVVPDISDVVAAQEAAQAAITAANTAAQTANTAAQNVGSIVARPYSSSSTYTAGDHCTNNGNLYKANQDISTAEEWTASHWTQIVMGDEVTDLKSAFDAFEGRIEKTNILYEASAITLTGMGTYVNQEVYNASAEAGQNYTACFSSQTGATSSSYIYMRFYDSNNTQLAQTASGTNTTLTYTAPANTAKIIAILAAANGTVLPSGSATFNDFMVIKGETASYEINPLAKYQRMDNVEDDIERIDGNINDILCYNLMGNDSSVYYPVDLVTGDKITFSKKDGTVFPSSSTLLCGLYNEQKGLLLNKALNTNTKETTYTIPSDKHIYYLKWNETPEDIMVNIGSVAKPYIEYNADTMDTRLKTVEKTVSALGVRTGLKDKETGLLLLGDFKNADVPFTKDDVKPGDIVHYYFKSPDGATIGGIRLKDSSNNNLTFYVNVDGYPTAQTAQLIGRDSTTRPEYYKGSIIIPTGFDHCYVQCNGSYTITIYELYVNRYEDRVATEAMDIPEYYFVDDYLQAKAQTINERLELCISKGDAFIFITDLHLKANQKHSPALIRYLYQHTSVRKLVYGGDLMDGGQANEYPITRKYTSEMREAFPCLQMFCVGNHDTFQNNPSSRISTWADTMMDKYTGDSDKHYFYYDDNRAKIRYIVLNRYYTGDNNTSSGFYVDTVQRDWFANTALDMENGYGAIVFIHNLYNFNYTVENPVMTIDVGCETYLSDVADAYNANPESKGEVIAIVQGHTHSDRVLRTTGGIPIIITTCDKNSQADSEQPDILFPDGVDDRESGTIREQAFDVMIVNRKRNASNKGTIYAIRVGCEAYDGTTVSDMGSATQERVILYDEKF